MEIINMFNVFETVYNHYLVNKDFDKSVAIVESVRATLSKEIYDNNGNVKGSLFAKQQEFQTGITPEDYVVKQTVFQILQVLQEKADSEQTEVLNKKEDNYYDGE